MPSAIVLGSGGFIGSALANSLRAMGWVLHCPGRDLVDLRNERDMWAALQVAPVDYIFHAADVGGDVAWSAANAGEQMLSNAQMAVNLLNGWKTLHSKARLVGFSSTWAYPNAFLTLDEDEYWNGPMHPDVAHYGVVKKLLGQGIAALSRQYGMKGCMHVLGNVYGPGDKSTRIIPSLIRRIRSDPNELEIYGDGSETRTFIFIDDQIEGIIQHRDHEGLINVAAGQPHSVRQAVEMLVELTGYKGRVVYNAEKARGSHLRRLSTHKARSFGWPRGFDLIPLREGLKLTLEST